MKKSTPLILILIFFSGITAFAPPAPSYSGIAKSIEIFTSLIKAVTTYYIDEVDPNQLMRTGMDAMLRSLDPYTNYISEAEVEHYSSMKSGQFNGIGAVARQFGKRIVISMVYENTPAYNGGLEIGDEIIITDGVPLEYLSLDESNRLMKGEVGKLISLTVWRPSSDKIHEFELKSESIKIPNIPYFGMATAKIGYVALSNFNTDSGKDVSYAVATLKQNGATSIVLDLRGNRGGLLSEAVWVCNIFLPKGKHVVSTKGKFKKDNVSYETTLPPLDLEIPVAILMDKGSASASEIVAGTLQDYDRAVVIGERSYGKGLVQMSRPLLYNSQVKITTAKFYTPSGRCIQALDYSHRRVDGSTISVPDSLKKPFLTANGRVVYEGGGIEPDIKVVSEDIPEIAKVLFRNGYFFDFASEYFVKHPSIASPGSFDLTDQEFQEFVNWVKQKDYFYRSPLDMILVSLVAQSKKEKLYDDIKPQLDRVSQKLEVERKKDLTIHKEWLRSTLAEEIVLRFYHDKGAIENRIRHDQELKMATRLLGNHKEYKKILKSY